MPRHKSAVKRTRQNASRAERNKAHISKMKTLVKQVRSSKNREEASIALKRAVKFLDQLGVKGAIHKKNASNQKARLTRFVNKIK
jgi:small subunit ribosomal protein S20